MLYFFLITESQKNLTTLTKNNKMKKIIFILSIFLFSLNMSSQNMFRAYFNIVNSSKDLQQAYNECNSFLNSPVVSTSNDKKITAYSFNTNKGRVVFGRNNSTKKIEAVSFLIYDDNEIVWAEGIIKAYFYEDSLGVIKNRYNDLNIMILNITVETDLKLIIGFGNESVFMSMPMSF